MRSQVSGSAGFSKRSIARATYAACSSASNPNFASSSLEVSASAASTAARMARSSSASAIVAMPAFHPA